MFRQRHTNESVRKAIKETVERNRQLTIEMFKEMGETFLKMTHEVKGYGNQTYNLSSSKGYMIFDRGKRIFEGGFEQLAATALTGVRKGKRLAEKEVKGLNGIVFIIVAGMHYAAAVESKGKNVITYESMILERMVKDLTMKMNK